MPVVPFQQPKAPGPSSAVDPVFVMAAVADLHSAGMLVKPESGLTAPTQPKVSDEPNGRG